MPGYIIGYYCIGCYIIPGCIPGYIGICCIPGCIGICCIPGCYCICCIGICCIGCCCIPGCIIPIPIDIYWFATCYGILCCSGGCDCRYYMVCYLSPLKC